MQNGVHFLGIHGDCKDCGTSVIGGCFFYKVLMTFDIFKELAVLLPLNRKYYKCILNEQRK